MEHFQSSGHVIPRMTITPGCRIQFLSPYEKGREERLYILRARRMRDRADREGWTSSELYTAINNGCCIGRVTMKEVSFHVRLHARQHNEAMLRAMVARIGGSDE